VTRYIGIARFGLFQSIVKPRSTGFLQLSSTRGKPFSSMIRRGLWKRPHGPMNYGCCPAFCFAPPAIDCTLSADCEPLNSSARRHRHQVWEWDSRFARALYCTRSEGMIVHRFLHEPKLIGAPSAKTDRDQSNHYDCGVWVLTMIATLLMGYARNSVSESRGKGTCIADMRAFFLRLVHDVPVSI
jgi:hypothetical protein